MASQRTAAAASAALAVQGVAHRRALQHRGGKIRGVVVDALRAPMERVLYAEAAADPYAPSAPYAPASAAANPAPTRAAPAQAAAAAPAPAPAVDVDG